MTKLHKICVLAIAGALTSAGCGLRPRPYPGMFGYAGCEYKGATYAHGSSACQSTTQYRCDDGQWAGRGAACTENLPAASQGYNPDVSLGSAHEVSCQFGTPSRCDEGGSRSVALACNDGGSRDPRTCMFNGATVAMQSTICRSGVTFLCEDNEWHDLATACR